MGCGDLEEVEEGELGLGGGWEWGCVGGKKGVGGLKV